MRIKNAENQKCLALRIPNAFPIEAIRVAAFQKIVSHVRARPTATGCVLACLWSLLNWRALTRASSTQFVCSRNTVQLILPQCVECARWYFKPFKFLYLFPHISQRYGLSFSMPIPSGYGVFDSGSMIEKVPSSFW